MWFLSSAEHNDATAFDREIIRRSRRVMAESDKLVVASMKRIAESQTWIANAIQKPTTCDYSSNSNAQLIELETYRRWIASARLWRVKQASSPLPESLS